jgi:hypothetical protein
MTKLLKGGSWHKLDSQMATAADEAWSARDIWGAVLLAVFFAATIVLAVFVGLQAKQVKRLKRLKRHAQGQADGRDQAPHAQAQAQVAGRTQTQTVV